MTSPTNVFILFAVVICVLLILKIQQKKEIANRIAMKFCRQNELQLLDGTVAFRGWHMVMPALAVAFRFRFEYSNNRVDRHYGLISLIGEQAQTIFINPGHVASHSE